MRSTLKIRLILSVACLFALFSLLVPLLLNIGGVSTSQASYPPPAHTEFNLITWSFTIPESPQSSNQSYVYNIYLNRICSTVTFYSNQTGLPTSESTQCLNNGVLGNMNLSHYYANAHLESTRAFQDLTTTNLKAPFALLIIAVLSATVQALTASLQIIIPKSPSSSTHILIGTTTAALTFSALLLTSAILTGQMAHLKRDMLLTSLELLNDPDADAHLGNTALGFLWGAAAVSFLGLAAWWEVRRMAKESVGKLTPSKVRWESSV